MRTIADKVYRACRQMQVKGHDIAFSINKDELVVWSDADNFTCSYKVRGAKEFVEIFGEYYKKRIKEL